MTCAISTRKGGVSPEPYGMNTSFSVGDVAGNVTENRQIFLNALGTTPDHLAIPEQKHTAVVLTVDRPGAYERCDALVTNVPNVWLSVSVADCTPVFLFDRGKSVIACIHAGWRGTQQRIAEKTLGTMRKEFGSDPTDVYAFLGPAAGQCCYEVGEEVANKFDRAFVNIRGPKKYLDLKRANESQLHAAGLIRTNIEIHGDCTICSTQLYHSYRRDKERSGRMMGVIGLKP